MYLMTSVPAVVLAMSLAAAQFAGTGLFDSLQKSMGIDSVSESAASGSETDDPKPWLSKYSAEDRAQIEETGTLTHHEPVAEDSLSWTFDADTGTLRISGKGPMKDYRDMTPEEQNARMLWDIDATKGWAEDAELPPWSEHAYDIRHIVIEDGVTSIGAFAFFGYYNNQTLTLPDSLEYVGRYACQGLGLSDDFTLPPNLKEIADGGFMETRIHAPFEFPEGLEIIGKDAFYANDFYDTITIPASLYFIHESAFANGLDLHHFIVSDKNEYYTEDEGVLYSKDKTVLLNYPRYKEEAEFTIPDSVKRLGDWSFGQNYFVHKITIPASVKEIGDSVFELLAVIEEFDVDEDSEVYRVIDGVLYSKDKKTLVCYPALKKGERFAVPADVKTIGKGAFTNCSYLKELYIPATVEYIDNYALRPLYNMSLYLPEEIADKTAMHMSNLLSSADPYGFDLTQGFVYIPPEKRDLKESVIYYMKASGEEVPSDEELDAQIASGTYKYFSLDHIRANAFEVKNPLKVFYGGSQEKWDQYVEKYQLKLYDTEVSCGAAMPEDLVKLSQKKLP